MQQQYTTALKHLTKPN